MAPIYPKQDQPVTNGYSKSSNGDGAEQSSIIHGSVPDRIDIKSASPKADDHANDFNFGKAVRLALRGRYLLVIFTGLITGAFAGWGGWKVGHPVYHSAGLIRIAYQLPKVLTDTDQNGPIQMFDTFMQSQKLLITSRRVIDIALQDPIWHLTGRTPPADPDQYFSKHLKVDIAPRSEFIEISVVDTDPGAAAAAVGSVINAYAQLYSSQEKQLERQRSGVLDDKQKLLEADIAKLNSEIADTAHDFGTVDLDVFCDAATSRVTKAKAALADIEAAKAMAVDTAPVKAGGDTKTSTAYTVAQIAANDPTMKGYLEQQQRINSDLDGLVAENYGDNHPKVIELRQRLVQVHNRIDQYAKSVNDYRQATGQSLDTAAQYNPQSLAGRSLAQLTDSEERLQKVYLQEQREMVDLGTRRMKLEQLQLDKNAKQTELTEWTHRTDVLWAEGSLGGRLSISSTGEIPLSPDKDPRMLFAGGAGLIGACLPTGLVIGLSLVSRRKYRYSEDMNGVQQTEIPLLGIIPALSSRRTLDDLESAAHSVHQVRVTLRSQIPSQRESSVYLVTSAAAGEGKTSLTMSLGLSFGACGIKTLIIDCDLVGRHMTTTLPQHDKGGLRDALAAGSMKDFILEVPGGLAILTTGRARANDAFSLSPSALARLLAEAREQYEIVLIDTGPVLGSVEAATLAPAVDGVLFAVSRDQQRNLVDRAVHRIQALGAHIEGFVFNRATNSDFGTSFSASSSGRSRSFCHDPLDSIPMQEVKEFKAFGPLVNAVAAGVVTRFNRVEIVDVTEQS